MVATSTNPAAGIEELWSAIDAHERYLDQSGQRAGEERRRLAVEIVQRVQSRVGEELATRIEREPPLHRLVDRVAAREIDPETAAERIRRNRVPAR